MRFIGMPSKPIDWRYERHASEARSQPDEGAGCSRHIGTGRTRSANHDSSSLLGCFPSWSFFAGRVQLPFSNPDGIVGTLTQIRYNPANNLVRFLLITLLPTIALAAFFLMPPARFVSRLFPLAPAEVSDKWRRTSAWRWFLPTALIITKLLVSLDTPSYMSAGSFNAFEEGLPLSAGMSYLSGGTPFRDFIFTHGLYDEPLRIAFAFKLFGPSIGAMRTLQSINKIVTFGLLAWFLIRLFLGSAVWSLFTRFARCWLEPAGELLPLNRAGLPSLHSVMIIPRDLSLFAFLVMLTFLADKIRRTKSADNGIFWIAMIWSAVPGLGYIHSMERGIYLFVAYAVIMPACYFLFFRGGPAARRFLTGCVLGIFLSSFSRFSSAALSRNLSGSPHSWRPTIFSFSLGTLTAFWKGPRPSSV